MSTKRQPDNNNRWEVGVINGPDHPDFDKIYDCYQACFPLEEEQESKENFLSFLQANQNSAKDSAELWVYIKDKETGEVVGASNFDVFPTSNNRDFDGTCQDIYTFVSEDYRKQGLFDELIALREDAASQWLSQADPQLEQPARLVTFAEQNNPLMMTPAEYIEDSNAAIDQNTRRNVFEKRGYKTLEMRYVQPALEEGGEVCDYLDFVAKTSDNRETIPGDVVREHLGHYFARSFPEGTSIDVPGLEGTKKDVALQDIPLSPRGKFGKLAEHLDVARLEALPESDHDTRIGDLKPELVEMHYGKDVSLEDVMDSMTAIRDKTGHTKGMKSPADDWSKKAEQPRQSWTKE